MRRALVLLATAAFLVAVASFFAATPALAATVTLRIEGSQQTLFEGPVSTQPHAVDGSDGTGPHPCSGGLGATPGPTATTALDDGARAAGIPWRGNWNPDFFDFFVESIGADASMPPEGYWGLLVNGVSAGGGCTTKVKDGDEVLWVYGAVFKPLSLKLTGPSTAGIGEPFVVTVTAGGAPVAGATVGGVLTDSAGQARISSNVPTRLLLKAERSDAIRSNELTVCVGIEVGCQAQAAALTAEVSIEKIEAGELFARDAGPRILRGEATGTANVGLQLSSREGGVCRSWNAADATMRKGPCGTPSEFAAQVAGGSWSARIGRLAPGKYTLRAGSKSPADSAAPVTFRVLSRTGSNTTLLKRGGRYLDSAQHRGGGLGVAPRAAPSLEMTGWATMALSRVDPAAATAGGRYLAANLKAGDPVADQVRSAFALASSDRKSNLLRPLCKQLAHRRGAGGSFAGDVNATALAVLALRTAGCDPGVAVRAARWLRKERNPDGGFGYRAGVSSDVDTTGLATWALAAVPRTRSIARSGVAFLRSVQNADGGFGSSPGSESNSQSTGLAVAGLRAAGVAPGAVHTEDGIDPIDYLTTLQHGPGEIDYSRRGRQTPVWTTSQALLGLGRGPFLPALSRAGHGGR